MIRVLIADDHNIFVEGIESLISGSPEIEVTQRCYSVSSVVEQLTKTVIDVVLLDISFPHTDDGLGVCPEFRHRHNDGICYACGGARYLELDGQNEKL